MKVGILLAHDTRTDLQLVLKRACDVFAPWVTSGHKTVGNGAISLISLPGSKSLGQGSQIWGAANLLSLSPFLWPLGVEHPFTMTPSCVPDLR